MRIIKTFSAFCLLGTTTAENFIAIKSSHVSNEDQSYLLDFRKRRGRPRKESDAHLEAKVSFAKSEGEAISVNQSNVQVVVGIYLLCLGRFSLKQRFSNSVMNFGIVKETERFRRE